MPPKKAGKRRVKKKQTGKGVADIAGKLVQLAKDTKILSKGLNTLAPDSTIAQTVSGMADQLGYGRQAMHGGSFFDTLGGIAGGVGHAAGSALNQTFSGLFGGSRGSTYAPVR